MTEIPLADAIAALRSELELALERGGDSKIKFNVDSVELELNAVVADETQINATAGLWKVVSFGGSAKASQQDTHKIVLKLRPFSADAPDRVLDVSDEEQDRPL